MSNNSYYVLIFTEWDYDWEDEEIYFFKTECEAKDYEKELKEKALHSNRTFIEQKTFEEIKDIMTLSDFEELFGISVDEPLNIDDTGEAI